MSNLEPLERIKIPSGEEVYVFNTCSSTMDVAWKLLEQGQLKERDSVLALTQEKGRGQWQRNWISPKGNLYVSMVLGEIRRWENLSSLFLGFLVRLSLQKMSVDIKLKWPNDLVFKEKKVGGILLEEKRQKLIAGIGINLKYTPFLGEQRCFPAGDLREVVGEVNVLSFWLALKRNLLFYLKQLGFLSAEELVQRLNECLAFKGRKVILEDGESKIEGTILGINHLGELLLLSKGKIRSFYSGSIIAFLD